MGIISFFVDHARWCTLQLRKTDGAHFMLGGVTTWKQRFDLYVAYCNNYGTGIPLPAAEEAYFQQKRKEWFSHLHLDEARSGLPACEVCAKLNAFLVRNDIPLDQRAVARHMRESHQHLADNEWLGYHSLVALAGAPSADYALFSLDGSDMWDIPSKAANTHRLAPCVSRWSDRHLWRLRASRRLCTLSSVLGSTLDSKGQRADPNGL